VDIQAGRDERNSLRMAADGNSTCEMADQEHVVRFKDTTVNVAHVIKAITTVDCSGDVVRFVPTH